MGEKARWELHKNASCCLGQTLEATPHKRATVELPVSNLTNHSNNMNKKCGTLMEK